MKQSIEFTPTETHFLLIDTTDEKLKMKHRYITVEKRTLECSFIIAVGIKRIRNEGSKNAMQQLKQTTMRSDCAERCGNAKIYQMRTKKKC